MTLTVRLDETLEAALERYCLATGSSKSLVVQESLAVYLMKQPLALPAGASKQGMAAEPSANYKAFADAGFLGAGTLTELTGGATKAAVRARVAASHLKRKARNGGA